MSLGKRISGLREKMGLNKSELAKVLKISHVQVIRYERDDSVPPTQKLKAIAEFFGVTTDYLLEGTRERNTSKTKLSQKELDKLMQLPDEGKRKVFEYVELLLAKYNR